MEKVILKGDEEGWEINMGNGITLDLEYDSAPDTKFGGGGSKLTSKYKIWRIYKNHEVIASKAVLNSDYDEELAKNYSKLIDELINSSPEEYIL